MTDAIAAFDGQWRFIQLNAAAARLAGRPREQLLGRSLWELLPERVAGPIVAQLHQAMDRREAIELSLPMGEAARWELRTFPTRDGLVLVARELALNAMPLKFGYRAAAYVRAAVDRSLDGFAVLSPVRDAHGALIDFRWEYVNDAAGRIVRMDPQRIVGERLLDLFPQSREGLFEIYARVLETGEPFESEIHYESESLRGWFRTMTVRVGESLAMTFNDITERKQAQEALRESEHQLDAILESINEGFILIDGELRVQYINRAAEEYFRKRRQDVLQVHVLDIYPELKQTPILQCIIEVLQTGERRAVELPSAIFPGRWVEARINPCHGMAAIFMADLTSHKRTEQRLREVKSTLERRVADRTAEAHRKTEQLRQLIDELGRVEHRERQRLARVLHDELQQLLIAARMRIDALRRRCQNHEKILGIITPIDTMLDESIQLTRNLTLDLAPPVLELGLVAALQWLAVRFRQRHQLQVHVQADASASPDTAEAQAFMLQAVQELLLNVVKHADTNEAWVTLDHAGERSRITVIDRGRGCDPQRLCPAAGATESFGLHAIRHRVRTMGGDMRVHSETGGCTVVIELAK